MLKRVLALGIATVAFGSLAFVDATSSTAMAGEGRPIGPEVCAQQLSFQAFQNACSNPAGNGWQIRPAQINITCNKRELVWVPSSTSMALRLPTSVEIDVSLGGKKKCVDDQSSMQSEVIEQATCFQFEQVERTYSRTIQATCDDLVRFNSAIEMCDATLKGAPGGWTQLPGERRTNLVMNSCTGQIEPDTSIPGEPLAPDTQPRGELPYSGQPSQ